jgi:predicted Zn finger-like uncharacterized protein
MYTRCPSCQTHFRVSREQLQASSGQVRCGRCQSVFDAFATLSAQPPTARTRGASESAPAPVADTPAPAAASAPPPARADEGTPQIGPAAFPAHDEILTLPDDLFGSGVAPQETGRRWPWAVGGLLLLVLLCAQGLFFFGTDLAASVPGLRPALMQGCEWLGCRVALARIPDQLFIEASDMQVLNPARAGEVLLTATIRNRAAATQELPLLEVTLTDAFNQTAARKVFYPAQYLDKTQGELSGVAPNQEILVKFYLDTGDIKPTGYRLYLFFA